jgi:hypothetical protein
VAPPLGWDFCLTMGMRLARRKALHPVLSRCRNVGRVGGANGAPEDWDREQRGLVFSDHADGFTKEWRIALRLPDAELVKMDRWMIDELRARQGGPQAGEVL